MNQELREKVKYFFKPTLFKVVVSFALLVTHVGSFFVYDDKLGYAKQALQAGGIQIEEGNIVARFFYSIFIMAPLKLQMLITDIISPLLSLFGNFPLFIFYWLSFILVFALQSYIFASCLSYIVNKFQK